MKLPFFWVIEEKAKTMTVAQLAAEFGCHRTSIYKTAAAQGFSFVSDIPHKLPVDAELRRNRQTRTSNYVGSAAAALRRVCRDHISSLQSGRDQTSSCALQPRRSQEARS